jgi:hypothetical protein
MPRSKPTKALRVREKLAATPTMLARIEIGGQAPARRAEGGVRRDDRLPPHNADETDADRPTWAE